MQKYGNQIVNQSWGGYIVAGINASVSNIDGGNSKITVVGKAGFWWIDGWSYAEIYTSGGGSYTGVINGGSGSESYIVDSSQYASGTINVEKGHSASSRTVSVDVWVSGEKSSVSLAVSIPAKTSYNVLFDANGGLGGPSVQTKWYNETFTIPSTVPTRKNYKFLGWATSKTRANSGIVDYNPGDTYSTNAALTLYAVWKRTGSVRIKVAGSWKMAQPYIKVNGSWKPAVSYIKVNGSWKEGT